MNIRYTSFSLALLASLCGQAWAQATSIAGEGPTPVPVLSQLLQPSAAIPIAVSPEEGTVQSLRAPVAPPKPAIQIQRVPSASPQQIYDTLKKQDLAKVSVDRTFPSGGDASNTGAIRYTGNSYDIVRRNYAPTPDIQASVHVVVGQKGPYPEWITNALKSEAPAGFPVGSPSTPQYLATIFDSPQRREEIAKQMADATPYSIHADWQNLWNTLKPGQQTEMWGGVIKRIGNEVVYKDRESCPRGCSFSILDKPMLVALNIPAIARYWEETHMLPMNGDMDGFEPNAVFPVGIPYGGQDRKWSVRLKDTP